MERTTWKRTSFPSGCATNKAKAVRRVCLGGKKTRDADSWRCATSRRAAKDSAGSLNYGFGFGVGGLLFPYYVGVVRELRSKGYIHKDTPTAGSSAGAMAAGIHISQLPDSKIESLTKGIMCDFRPKCRIGRLRKVVYKRMDRYLPDNIHELASGRVMTVLCKLPTFEAVKVLHYKSKDDFICAMLASSHVPLYMDCTLFVNYQHHHYIDAIFSDCIPVPNGQGLHLVRVSCFPRAFLQFFRRNSDIYYGKCGHERHQLGSLLNWIFNPPTVDAIYELIAQGEDDASAWIAEQEGARLS